MTITTTWNISIGTVTSPTSFTSRVAGFSIQQSVNVNEVGRGICRITLYNKDGALTPGGGGTYGSTDWFAQGLFISANTSTGGAPTVTQVFHGIITDFELDDTGVFSTVMLTAQDGLTIGGRSIQATLSGGTTIDYLSLLNQTTNNSIGNVQLSYPRLGMSGATSNLNELREFVSGTADQPESCLTPVTPQNYTSVADIWQTALLPIANDIMYATTISTSGSNVVYNFNTCSFSNSRASANRVLLPFSGIPLNTTSSLPFESLKQGFNNADLVTNAQYNAITAGIGPQSATASSVNTYGNRSVSFTQTVMISSLQATRQASLMVNRYGTSRFNPVSLVVKASQVAKLCNDAAHFNWYTLLGINSGLWQPATVRWAGSGSSTQTATCVIKGRIIDVTPADTTVTLELGNWADNHGFILDFDELDEDRLN